MLTAMTATASDTRVPYTTRLSWSRPRLSVPSRWTAEGGWSTIAGSGLMGSYGASSGAKTPINTITRMTTPKMISRGSRSPVARARRATERSTPAVATARVRGGCSATTCTSSLTAASAVADARIEVRVGDVDNQVRGQEHEHRQQHHRLDRGVVARAKGLDRQTANARPGKHGFDDERAFQDCPHLQTQERHARDQPVAQRVPQDHRGFGEALGARGANVVLMQRVEHTGANEARLGGRAEQAQGDGRQDDAA